MTLDNQDQTEEVTPTEDPRNLSALSEPIATESLRGAIEAILMVAEVPLSIVHLATSLDMPVTEVREAVLAVKADFDGENGTRPRGFELREVGGGWRVFVREEYE
ncbi:MAG: SMC-Scp complex subunit ScpB, partial [Microbacteriaceae bacterium]|nr:SMC-Scp complex subunit ScpB [Microbacteriaceae bacterium]